MTRKFAATYLAILMTALWLLGFNLGDRLLWGDEAETALLAVNITKFGIPKADDGANRITLLDGHDWNEDGVWTWSPWLDEYLAAGSMLLFGETTVAARLPFVLFGAASVALIMLLAFRLYGTHAAAVTAGILLLSCVPFLLHARQSRYYAVLVFSQLWLLWGLRDLLIGKTARGAVHTGFALVAQFYCNYIAVAGNVLALGFLALVWARRVKGLFAGIVAAGALLAALGLPWLLYAPPGGQVQMFEHSRPLEALLFYLREIHFHVVPLALLLLPLAVALLRWIGRRGWSRPFPRREQVLWVFVVAHLLVLSVSPLVFFRYLMPLLPVLILLATGVIERYLAPLPLRAAIVSLLSLGNLLAWVTAWPGSEAHPPQLTLPRYVRAISTDYTDRCEDVIAYLAQEAAPGQTLLVPDPEFPLIFYTGLQIVDARIREAPAGGADWILETSPCAPVPTPPLELPRDWRDRYEPVLLQVHASPRGCRRPDPHAYCGFTAAGMETFTLYRKVDQ